MLGMRLALYQCLICDTCGREIRDAQREEEMTEVALFGAVPFAVCPTCSQKSGVRTVPYRKAWLRKKVERMLQSEAVEPLNMTRLRQFGYRPLAHCTNGRPGGKRYEYISYPYFDGGKVVIHVRQVNKPWTMAIREIHEFIPFIRKGR